MKEGLYRSAPVFIPHHLAGEEIPFLARLLAVTNVYDSLRTDSPARPGMPVGKAAEALRRAAGKELDPSLTEAFLRVLGVVSTPKPAAEPPS